MRSIKVRIYPNSNQVKKINNTFGSVRFVYNQALVLKIKRYKEFKENVPINEISKMVTFWKNTEERSWLKESNAQGLQQALRHLDTAYKRFFKKQGGFPKFKKKHDKQTYSVVGNVSIVDNKIRFPKLGILNCRGLRKFNGKIKTATISKNKAGQYFMPFCINDVEKKEKVKNVSSILGVDVGVKTMAACSNGNKYYSSNYLKEIESKLKYYQRSQAKCKKGSRPFKKWKLKIARIWNKITNIKKDFLHKLSNDFVKNHDLIVVEDLKVSNMLKNHKLAKAIQNMSWYEFFRQLEYKCGWYGKHFVKVAPHNTSKMCSNCSFLNNDLKLSDREWICEACTTSHDRDLNVSINIKSSGGINISLTDEARILLPLGMGSIPLTF